MEGGFILIFPGWHTARVNLKKPTPGTCATSLLTLSTMPPFCSQLCRDADQECAAKGLYAVAALVRNMQSLRAAFVAAGEPSHLCHFA